MASETMGRLSMGGGGGRGGKADSRGWEGRGAGSRMEVWMVWWTDGSEGTYLRWWKELLQQGLDDAARTLQ